jgi:hypothetical protein
MNAHVTDLIYEYACGQLDEPEMKRVQEHLAGCTTCTTELAGMRQTLERIPRQSGVPSDVRDASFWTAFANAIEARVRVESPRHASFAASLRDHITSFVTLNRAPLLAGAGAVGIIAAAIIVLWPRPSALEERPVVADRPATQRTVEPASARMSDYLKRSKVLLVGLSNMQTDGGRRLDLREERKQSRVLVQEARFLRQQPLDARSARLIGDLERILIELGNIEVDHNIPNVDLIRTGIHRENLLFKIRMTESILDAELSQGDVQ